MPGPCLTGEPSVCGLIDPTGTTEPGHPGRVRQRLPVAGVLTATFGLCGRPGTDAAFSPVTANEWLANRQPLVTYFHGWTLMTGLLKRTALTLLVTLALASTGCAHNTGGAPVRLMHSAGTVLSSDVSLATVANEHLAGEAVTPERTN